MKTIKTFEQFINSSYIKIDEAAIDAGGDSRVVVDDVSLDSGEEIKSTEILGVILSSKTEKEFKEYFYKEYGNTAFTEEDIFALVKFYNDYTAEVNQAETDAEEKKKEEEEGGTEDPLAGI
jgi:hypothetical protein